MERQTRRLPNHQAGIARKLTDKSLGQTVPVPTTSQGSCCADLCADRTRRRPGARVIGRAFRSMGSAETLNAPRLCPKLGLRTARESITNINVWLLRANCWPGPGIDRIRPLFLVQCFKVAFVRRIMTRHRGLVVRIQPVPASLDKTRPAVW
jgi:hypothetical protein